MDYIGNEFIYNKFEKKDSVMYKKIEDLKYEIKRLGLSDDATWHDVVKCIAK